MKKLLYAACVSIVMISAVQAEWTSSFSEEGRSWQLCPGNQALRGVQCTGDYCDNLSLYCRGQGLGAVSNAWWTRSISEESTGGRDTVDGVVVRVNDNMQRCGTNAYIAGMRCSGRYCDNVSLYCKQFQNKRPNNCNWTSWVSEEHGGRLVFGSNQYAVGMECIGEYCDTKRFLVCQ